jgi:hypothetical protein
MEKLLFIVTEIAPFDKGGIGTFSRNMIRKFSEKYHMAFLYCGNSSLADIEGEYPKIQFYSPVGGSQALMGKSSAQISEIVAGTLDIIFQKDVFDYVEFMDWGGWAHATIMSKRSGESNIPWSTGIVVRVHSTEHALRKIEHRLLSLRDGEISDFELASLFLADAVICHVEPIARLVAAEIKGLFGRDISGKILVTPMPVCINQTEQAHSIIPNDDTNIVFSSKTQHFKRPDLFVMGAGMFLSRHKDYKAKIIFAAHIVEDDYTRTVFSLIPKEQEKMFVNNQAFTPGQRDNIISEGITVFASEYESFCFAAYEASLLGSVVILNETNPAFSDGTHWTDNVNCIKFDGTADGLCAALERANALKTPLHSVKACLPEPQILFPPAPMERKTVPTVDVLLQVRDTKGLNSAVTSLKLNGFDTATNIHLFVMQNAVRDMEAVMEAFPETRGKFTVVPDGVSPIWALAQCARKSMADYILYMSSSDELASDILYSFTKSFKNYDIDVFSSWTRNARREGYLNRFYGAMPFNAWRYNMIAPPLAFYKTALLKDYFKKAGGRIFNFYAMHLYFTMMGANYVVSRYNECVCDNPYHEYSIHQYSSHVQKSAFFRAVLLDFLPISPPSLAVLMATATKPEAIQPVAATGPASKPTLPSFDTYIYRKYIKKIRFLDNILRRFKIVT